MGRLCIRFELETVNVGNRLVDCAVFCFVSLIKNSNAAIHVCATALFLTAQNPHSQITSACVS